MKYETLIYLLEPTDNDSILYVKRKRRQREDIEPTMTMIRQQRTETTTTLWRQRFALDK